MLWLVLSCSDYNLLHEDKQEPAEGVPLLQIEPSVVDIGAVCASDLENNGEIVWVQLQNAGTAVLTIEALEVTGNWRLQSDPTPVDILPSATQPISLIAGEGAGMLVISSTDPDHDIQQVPLASTVDQAPILQVISPINGDIVEGETTFVANISDDFDPLESLMVQWRSSVDGVFSSSPPDSTGSSQVSWLDSHTSGQHTIQVMASDSCGNTVSSLANVCQQLRYDVENVAISTWHFEGTANWDSNNNWLELTPVVTNAVGTAFSTAQIVPGGQVEIDFMFYIGDGTGADGISLTALDVDRMTTFLGGTGCGIGYGGDASCTNGPALPGWSIEVDTYFNGGQDPTELDHVMLTFDGDVDNPAVWAALPEMEDTGWHHMRVLVREPHVIVEIDNVVYIDQDVPGYYAFNAYVGFTAGTGGATNQHLIDSLVVSEQLCGD